MSRHGREDGAGQGEGDNAFQLRQLKTAKQQTPCFLESVTAGVENSKANQNPKQSMQRLIKP